MRCLTLPVDYWNLNVGNIDNVDLLMKGCYLMFLLRRIDFIVAYKINEVKHLRKARG